MTINYEVVTSDLGDTCIKAILENGNILLIPMDESNSDYQAYLNKDNPDWNKPHTF
jgi:hypothetical protein